MGGRVSSLQRLCGGKQERHLGGRRRIVAIAELIQETGNLILRVQSQVWQSRFGSAITAQLGRFTASFEWSASVDMESTVLSACLSHDNLSRFHERDHVAQRCALLGRDRRGVRPQCDLTDISWLEALPSTSKVAPPQAATVTKDSRGQIAGPR